MACARAEVGRSRCDGFSGCLLARDAGPSADAAPSLLAQPERQDALTERRERVLVREAIGAPPDEGALVAAQLRVHRQLRLRAHAAQDPRDVGDLPLEQMERKGAPIDDVCVPAASTPRRRSDDKSASGGARDGAKRAPMCTSGRCAAGPDKMRAGGAASGGGAAHAKTIRSLIMSGRHSIDM